MKQANPQVAVSINWVPFLLNPTTPKEGYDLGEYLASKYGPAALRRMSDPNNPLSVAGRPHNISFDSSRRIVNTVNSHKLLSFVKNTLGDEVEDRLMEIIFRTYFQEAKDINNIEILCACAEEAGISDISAVRDLLQTEAGKEEILMEDRKVKRELRVSGVPYFVFQREDKTGPVLTLSGAQPPDAFEEVFEALA